VANQLERKENMEREKILKKNRKREKQTTSEEEIIERIENDS